MAATILGIYQGGTGESSVTSGLIPFAVSTNALGQDSNLYWDNTNKRLGINIGSSPNYPIDIGGSGTLMKVGNAGFAADAYISLNSRFAFGYDGTYHAAKIWDGGNNKPLYITLSNSDRYLFENFGSTFHLLMPQPTGQAAVAAVGGNLAGGTYYIKVTALDIVNQETGQYTEVSCVVDGVTNKSVNISWNAPSGGVSGYRVYYGTTTNGQANYFPIAAGVTSFSLTTTTGSTAGTLPTYPQASGVSIAGNGTTWFNGGFVGIYQNATPAYPLDIGGQARAKIWIGTVTKVAGAGASQNCDWSLSQTYKFTLTNATPLTVSFSNPVDGIEVELILIQPASGTTASITLPSSVIWVGGIAPTFSNTLGARDRIRLKYDSDISKYIGTAIIGYAQ